MLSPIIRRARKDRNEDPRSKERGVTIALVAVAMVSIIAMAALSIDIGTLYQAKAQAQRAADAAALTAARVISISGITGDPNNTSGAWQLTCGAGGTATLAATAVAQVQANFVGGIQASKVTVTYGTGAATDCSTLSGATSAFSVNPTVNVYVQQATLPTFFGRIFGLIPGGTSSNSGVSATATAEVFNPSNSGSFASSGEMVPVQPRCVKPWIVPNKDPGNPAGCSGAGCLAFVGTTGGPTEGSIGNPGMLVNGVGVGVIGETFTLTPDCSAAAGNCNTGAPFSPQPFANVGTPLPSLQYLPGLAPATSAAVPRCAIGGGAYPNSLEYQEAIAGCDQSTAYQCGVNGSVTPNQLDLTENPGGITGDTATAVQCLAHESAAGLGNGQDTLLTNSLPYQIQAGTANPVPGITSTSLVSSSTSIVSLPIYDGNLLTVTGTTANVNIVGFLQVFINYIDANGNPNVTVLNVAGCGNGVTTPNYETGTSPVPVRLITPP
jgi:Flp pilus assembly protein TadG